MRRNGSDVLFLNYLRQARPSPTWLGTINQTRKHKPTATPRRPERAQFQSRSLEKCVAQQKFTNPPLGTTGRRRSPARTNRAQPRATQQRHTYRTFYSFARALSMYLSDDGEDESLSRPLSRSHKSLSLSLSHLPICNGRGEKREVIKEILFL